MHTVLVYVRAGVRICGPFPLFGLTNGYCDLSAVLVDGNGIKVDSSFSQQQSPDVQHLVTEPGRITLLLPVVLVLACLSACGTTNANLFKLGDSFRNFRIRYPWVDNGDVRHCGFSCFSMFSTLKWTPIPACWDALFAPRW